MSCFYVESRDKDGEVLDCSEEYNNKQGAIKEAQSQPHDFHCAVVIEKVEVCHLLWELKEQK
jgi:hypothetical protein